MSKQKKSWIILLALFLVSRPVYGYIDPGTGGMIIGSIWPAIVALLAAAAAFFIGYFKRIKKWFLGLWKKKR